MILSPTKKSFYDTFFEYASFITEGPSKTLDCTHNQNWEQGLKAFFRLIGCEFFKTHSALFASKVVDRKPTSLFVNTLGNTLENNISNWLSTIRKTLLSGTPSEDYYLPSEDSLKLHWQRVCAVAQIWQQASKNYIVLPVFDQWGFGFNEDNEIIIKWDSELNFRRTDMLVQLWTKGCKCKAGCISGRCGCRRDDKPCGPGCACSAECHNSPEDPTVTSMLDLYLNTSAQNTAHSVPEIGAEIELENLDDLNASNSDDDYSSESD